MANTVNGAFAEFLRDKVNLDPGDTATARASRDWLFGQIEKFQSDEFYPKSYDEHDISFGSFARRTKIRPLDDIDIMTCLSAQGATYLDHDGRIEITAKSGTSLEALCDSVRLLNSVKMINRLITKLGSVPQYANAHLKRNGSAAVLALKSYDWVFDIVPCFMTAPEWDGRTYYLIPDGSGNWMKTDPRIDRERVKEINKMHGGKMLNVLRAVKFWNARPTMPSVGSYLLEAMVLEYYANRADEATGFVDIEIPRVLDHISRAIYGRVWDPKNIQGDLNDLPYDTKRKISERAAADLGKAREARRLESAGDPRGSINKWREFFGNEFPDYG